MVATFDGDTLSEAVFSVHTGETAPQGLILHPLKKHLLCIFSGDRESGATAAIYGAAATRRPLGTSTTLFAHSAPVYPCTLAACSS